MKKTNLLFFLLTVLMSMVSIKAFAYDIAVENDDGITIYYNYTSDGKELVVTYKYKDYSYNSSAYSGTIVIPDEVTYMNRTRKVTSIAPYAFQYCSGLISVTIPNSVISIESGAFQYCNNLKKVIVKDIAAWCNIDFGDNPLSHAQYLYNDENTEITDLVIPNSVTNIRKKAFSYCKGLASVVIPNSVTCIEEDAFNGCI